MAFVLPLVQGCSDCRSMAKKKPDLSSRQGAIQKLKDVILDDDTPAREIVNAVKVLSGIQGFGEAIDWGRQPREARLRAVREVIAPVIYQLTGMEVEFADDNDGAATLS